MGAQGSPPGQFSLLLSPLAWGIVGFVTILHLSLFPSHALGPSPSYLCQIAWHIWIADKRLDCQGTKSLLGQAASGLLSGQ